MSVLRLLATVNGAGRWLTCHLRNSDVTNDVTVCRRSELCFLGHGISPSPTEDFAVTRINSLWRCLVQQAAVNDMITMALNVLVPASVASRSFRSAVMIGFMI